MEWQNIRKSMKNFIKDQAIVSTLSKFKGAYAQIWKFNLSHKKLAIKLSFALRDESLYLLCTSCEYIQGPFAWNNCDLEYEANSVSNDNGDILSGVTDKISEFKLVASGGISFMLVTESDIDFLEDF